MANFYATYPFEGGGSGGGGVTTLNGESGAVVLVGGADVSVTPAGQNITVAYTGPVSAFVKIAQVVCDGTSGSVIFSSIPQTYTSLKLIFFAASQNVDNPPDPINLTFNGDVSASYNWAIKGISNSASNGSSPDTQIDLPGATSTLAGSFPSSGQFIISSYTSPTLAPSLTGSQSFYSNDGAGDIILDTDNFAGNYLVAGPINTINLTLLSGSNYLAGSVFTLYGIS